MQSQPCPLHLGIRHHIAGHSIECPRSVRFIVCNNNNNKSRAEIRGRFAYRINFFESNLKKYSNEMNFSTLALLLLAHPLVRVHARLAGSDAQLRRNLQETSCLAAAVTNGEINASHEVEEFDCNVDALLEKIEGLMEGVAGCANKSATDELSILVGTDDDAKNLCTASEDRWHEENDNPFISIFNEGKMHDKEFYDGNTKYNTMRQTDLELGSGAFASNVLEDDAGRLERILENRKNGAEKAGITWPDYTSQFESCELRAAMCCWSQDRQANDDNGNCGTPYDDECLGA